MTASFTGSTMTPTGDLWQVYYVDTGSLRIKVYVGLSGTNSFTVPGTVVNDDWSHAAVIQLRDRNARLTELVSGSLREESLGPSLYQIRRQWSLDAITERQLLGRRHPRQVLTRPRQTERFAKRTCSQSSRWRVQT